MADASQDEAAFRAAVATPSDAIPEANAPLKPAKAAKAAAPEKHQDDEDDAPPPAKGAKAESARASAAAPAKKTTASAPQADDEGDETGTEDDEDDGEQESAYNAALKTLELDELTPEDVHGWSKKAVIAFAEKRAAVHAKLNAKLSQANSQRGETTRSGTAQGTKLPQGHPLVGLQERHVKEIAALWDDESAQAIVKVIGESASAYAPVFEELQASLKSGDEERAALRDELKELRDEVALDRMHRQALAQDPSLAEGDTWDRVAAQMKAQKRTGNYKDTPKGRSRLLADSLAIVNRDRNKTLQTDRARDLGQPSALPGAFPAMAGPDRDTAAFRAATRD